MNERDNYEIVQMWMDGRPVPEILASFHDLTPETLYDVLDAEGVDVPDIDELWKMVDE